MLANLVNRKSNRSQVFCQGIDYSRQTKGIVDDGACSLICAFGACLIDLLGTQCGTNVSMMMLDAMFLPKSYRWNLPLSLLLPSLLRERLLLRLRRDDFLSLEWCSRSLELFFSRCLRLDPEREGDLDNERERDLDLECFLDFPEDNFSLVDRERERDRVLERRRVLFLSSFRSRERER